MLFATAGYNTTYFGPGRKEFSPKGPHKPFEEYLLETARGTCSQLAHTDFDEGVIANFMAPRFLQQANLPGFLPFMVPKLKGKPCTGVEGACGSGGRALATAMRILRSGDADSVFVAGFELQNSVKPVYGADYLAGADYFAGRRKQGHAHYFPGIFAERAKAYYARYGYKKTRHAMALWYERAIQNARKNPKAQEHHNEVADLYQRALTDPNPEKFLDSLNSCDCSKITDGASSILLLTERGREKLDVCKEDCIELMGLGMAEGDITQPPSDPTALVMTKKSIEQALARAGISKEQLGVAEIHDCFSITALLTIEAMGLAPPGEASCWIENPTLPINPSGGLIGFGHPVGASGVRQLVDLWEQLTGRAPNQQQRKTPYGMMCSMGGNDITLTAIVAKGSE